MLGQDLDPELLQALQASQAEYEAQQKRLEEEAKVGEELEDPELLLALQASQAEYEAQQKTNEKEKEKETETVVEVDEDLNRAIALSLTGNSSATPIQNSSTKTYSQKEIILLTRQLRFMLKISSDEIETCLSAVQAQTHWDTSFQALEAYEKSTKEYSAQGLLTFLQEGPREKAALTPNTPHEIEKKPSNTEEKKPRFK
jgi:hypothetical protein